MALLSWPTHLQPEPQQAVPEAQATSSQVAQAVPQLLTILAAQAEAVADTSQPEATPQAIRVEPAEMVAVVAVEPTTQEPQALAATA